MWRKCLIQTLKSGLQLRKCLVNANYIKLVLFIFVRGLFVLQWEDSNLGQKFSNSSECRSPMVTRCQERSQCFSRWVCEGKAQTIFHDEQAQKESLAGKDSNMTPKKLLTYAWLLKKKSWWVLLILTGVQPYMSRQPPF